MKKHLCPKCETEMQTTYEPYELRCPSCDFWFDTYTGKEITFAENYKPEVTVFDGTEFMMTGWRLGEIVEISHKPQIQGLIVGRNSEKCWWLAKHITPKGIGGHSIFTDDFLDYVGSIE